MSIDSLEEPKDDPDVHGENVEFPSTEDVENRTSDRSSTEDENFSWVSILSGKPERSRILVVNFVNILVHGTPVEELMGCQTR